MATLNFENERSLPLDRRGRMALVSSVRGCRLKNGTPSWSAERAGISIDPKQPLHKSPPSGKVVHSLSLRVGKRETKRHTGPGQYLSKEDTLNHKQVCNTKKPKHTVEHNPAQHRRSQTLPNTSVHVRTHNRKKHHTATHLH